jgi:transposase-like protein
MAKRKRRLHTPEEKVAILRLHLIEKQSVSDICEEHKINPNLFYRWQKEFFENGAAAFSVNKSRKEDTRDAKINELEAKLADRDEGIAELMMDHVKLKKKLGLS